MRLGYAMCRAHALWQCAVQTNSHPSSLWNAQAPVRAFATSQSYSLYVRIPSPCLSYGPCRSLQLRGNVCQTGLHRAMVLLALFKKHTPRVRSQWPHRWPLPALHGDVCVHKRLHQAWTGRRLWPGPPLAAQSGNIGVHMSTVYPRDTFRVLLWLYEALTQTSAEGSTTRYLVTPLLCTLWHNKLAVPLSCAQCHEPFQLPHYTRARCVRAHVDAGSIISGREKESTDVEIIQAQNISCQSRGRRHCPGIHKLRQRIGAKKQNLLIQRPPRLKHLTFQT